jgi:lysozyme
MTLSNETLTILSGLIKEFEGCRLTAYRCPAGVPTIGYGATVFNGAKVRMGMTITQEQANQQLSHDMQVYWEDALKWSPSLVNASPSRQAAIIDFTFNCGVGNYHISSLLKSVNAGNWSQASRDILRWNKARVKGVLKVLPGLVRRREAESRLLGIG